MLQHSKVVGLCMITAPLTKVTMGMGIDETGNLWRYTATSSEKSGYAISSHTYGSHDEYDLEICFDSALDFKTPATISLI